MTDREFLWCVMNLILDDEEELARLCPGCRSRAMEERCVNCGSPVSEGEGGVNGAFDQGRFERLKRGERG